MSGPFTAVPSNITQNEVSRNKRAKRAMRLIWIAVALSVISMLVAGSKQVAPKSAPPTTAPPNYAGQAQQVVWDYLSDVNSSMPVASGLQPNLGRTQGNTTQGNFGVQQISYIKDHFYNMMISPATQQQAAVYQRWVTDVFQAVTKNGTYMVSVDLNLAGTYPVVAAYPALQPIPSPGQTSSLPPITLTGTPISSGSNLYKAISAQASAWATAYASNNQVTLYQLSQDQQQQHFLGLGGYTAQTVTVLSATQSSNNTALALVQVSFKSNSNDQLLFTSDYSVLFDQLSAAAPPPVDWGPAGSFGTLKPYGNALPGLSGQQK